MAPHLAAPRHHLAMYNFGLHVDDYESPAVEGFRLREAANFAAAERAKGFVGRSRYAGVEGPESWGEQVFPRFIAASGLDSGPSSLSLWQDLESLMAFSYNGVHADALKHARHWNRKQSWPSLVLWWVDAGTRPAWADGVARLEHLHDKGPSPFAFTFKAAFDSSGEGVVIDRGRVRQLAEANAPDQADLLAHVHSLKP
ncbi:uncharacterized protein DUF3291 [Rhizobium subbaraonis]|uniref:Uncharacterized protein DUF3291 n=1 Tax=Rhizobium subbaraonis TaxID=908946 RepID=A0A285UZD6_9HYPH|nr:DUF3291 domain-containing protein [Rhizobium subbaraonis]SOC47180.1 uncharacterized protein DUF3291 [Rhizobium subbaraonis]